MNIFSEYFCLHSWELSNDNGMKKRRCKKCGLKQFAVEISDIEWVDEPKPKPKKEQKK